MLKLFFFHRGVVELRQNNQNYVYPKTYGLKYILKMNALQAHRVLFPIIISDLFRQT